MSDAPGSTATRVVAPHIKVRYARVRVEVVAGRDRGKSVEVAGRAVRVGTAPECDLALTDDSVSRAHAELEPAPGGLRVRDVGSTNGIVAGGVRIVEAIVPLGSRLRVGDTELALVALGDVVEVEQTTRDRFGDVLGASPRMRELFADLERIAAADVTLLVEGETGTGKDLVAESVHAASARAAGPFVVLDCGAVSPSLVESELFGHERGAFTGAAGPHAGVFEQADGGTLFLDEVGELPLELQPKLLRALEKRQIRRVGGSKTIDLDVRVVAATNRRLRAEVEQGRFRQDLYFRLAAAHVTVPALRERLEDVPLLVEHFLARERPPRSPESLSREVWELLKAYRWPGNVRELRNAVARLLVTPDRAMRDLAGEGGAVPSPAQGASDEPLPLRVARRDASDAFERDYLEGLLAATGGNVTRAAALAEVSRQAIQKLMKKHGRE